MKTERHLSLRIDDDLLRNSGDGFETVIKMGERIGIAQ